MAPQNKMLKRKNHTRRKKLPRPDFMGKESGNDKPSFIRNFFASITHEEAPVAVEIRTGARKASEMTENFAALKNAPRGDGIVRCRCHRVRLEDCPSR